MRSDKVAFSLLCVSCVAGDVLQEVTDADISENLMKRFAEEKYVKLDYSLCSQ